MAPWPADDSAVHSPRGGIADPPWPWRRHRAESRASAVRRPYGDIPGHAPTGVRPLAAGPWVYQTRPLQPPEQQRPTALRWGLPFGPAVFLWPLSTHTALTCACVELPSAWGLLSYARPAGLRMRVRHSYARLTRGATSLTSVPLS